MRRGGADASLRNDPTGWDSVTDAPWPGINHFQLRAPVAGPEPTFGTVLPTHPESTLVHATTREHARAIQAGGRPAALLLSWAERRVIRGEHPERFLVSIVLDGHHKLHAHPQQGVPARALLLCRVEASWGPPQERSRWLQEMTEPLRITPR